MPGCWRVRIWRLIPCRPMRIPTTFKCLNCNEKHCADPRNRWHQRYCSKPECRRASKASSQLRWSQKPGNETYFRGAVNTERSRQWRKGHPDYWRNKKAVPQVALQDVLKSQATSKETVVQPELPFALQDVCLTQPALLVGLISIMTGHAQQDDIALSARLFLSRGEDILRMTPRGPALPNHENENNPVPRTPAARAPPV